SAPQFIRPRLESSSFTIMTNSRTNRNACATYRRMDSSPRSALAFAANELLDAAIGFVVGHLDGRMFGEIGRGRMQHATNAAIQRKLAATDSVDGHAGGVWRIFDGKFHIDLHRHIAKQPAFHTNKSNLV